MMSCTWVLITFIITNRGKEADTPVVNLFGGTHSSVIELQIHSPKVVGLNPRVPEYCVFEHGTLF